MLWMAISEERSKDYSYQRLPRCRVYCKQVKKECPLRKQHKIFFCERAFFRCCSICKIGCHLSKDTTKWPWRYFNDFGANETSLEIIFSKKIWLVLWSRHRDAKNWNKFFFGNPRTDFLGTRKVPFDLSRKILSSLILSCQRGKVWNLDFALHMKFSH